jgi:hypothetical protein
MVIANGMAVRQRRRSHPKMKKLMSIMLGLALVVGTASITLAQDKEETKQATKKGKAKKGKAPKDGKTGKNTKKGKGKKGKDADATK